MLKKRIVGVALAALIGCGANPVAAQVLDAERWSFVAGVGTENRSKGVSKSQGQPYGWGAAEWESASGFVYAGPQFQTIRGSDDSRLEVQLNAGIRPQVAGFDLNFRATHRWRVEMEPGADDSAWILVASAQRSVGPASARLQVQHSPDGIGAVKEWTWVEARLGWEFTDKLSGSAMIGRREQNLALDHTGWNIGATYALRENLDLDIRWHDTDSAAHGERYESALVAEVNVYF
jgi:hypothetical protein